MGIALVAVAAALLAFWRFGLRGLAGTVAAIWLAGIGWIGLGPATPDRFTAFAWWVVSGAALLIGLGYTALLGALRRRARGEGSDTTDLRPYRAALAEAPAQRPVAGPDASPATSFPSLAPADPAGPLSDPELDRYARHIVLRELGGAGQRRLRAARVLVVGAGALGSPVLMYLAAAGVGRITIADDDTVSLSNLQRQVIFATGDIGRAKVDAAADRLAALNPHVAVTRLNRRVTDADTALIAAHDLVLDGTDSFASRSAVNAACVAAGVPLISGAIAQWEAQVTLYDPARGGPCLACLFPNPPAPGLAPSCAEAGVVGALPGVTGSLMALEAIKLIAAIPDSGAGAGLRGQMVLFDGLWGDTRRIATAARHSCAVCGGRGAAG